MSFLGGGEWIPSIPWGDNVSPDPNRRDAQIVQPDRSGRDPRESSWMASKSRWSFNTTTGELESRFYMRELDPREINIHLAEAQERYGKENVRSLGLWLAPDCVTAYFSQLQVMKFQRAEHREGKIPQMFFRGPARPWAR